MLDLVKGAPAPTADAGKPIRVLAVEDSAANLYLIQCYLKAPSFQLDTASNGVIAVQKFQSGEYDVVLMDVQMPVMDRYTATRMIRAWEVEHQKRQTPVLALTAHSLEEQQQESLAAGCNAHLVKPVHKAALLEAIQTFVSQTRAETPRTIKPEEILAGAREAVPLLLELTRGDLQNLRDALEAADYSRIRFIGHDLKGSGGGFGFDGVSAIGKLIEEAAKRIDGEEVSRQIAALADYLDRVKVICQ